MTPPINIDGSEVTGITIDGTSVSEVTVDGDVVFGNTIPDSEVTQADLFWPASDGSGQTITEQRQNNDASITGATWESGSFYDGTAVLYDGSDDLANADLGSPSYTEYSVFVGCRLDSGAGEQYPVEMEPNWEPGPSIRVTEGTTIEAFTYDGSTRTLTGPFDTGELRTIGVTSISNDEAFLMSNGTEADSVSVGSLANLTKEGINFGASRRPDRHWDGVVDVVLFLIGDSWTRSDHQSVHDNYMGSI